MDRDQIAVMRVRVANDEKRPKPISCARPPSPTRPSIINVLLLLMQSGELIDWRDRMPLVADESSLVVVNDEDANLFNSSGSAILTAADERRNSTSDDSGYSNKSSSPTDSVTHQTAGSVR